MKKLIMFFIVALLVNLSALEVETNDLHNVTGYNFTNQEDADTNDMSTEFSYEFEAVNNEINTFTLEAAIAYSMESMENSIKDANEETSNKAFSLSIAPAYERELIENLSYKIALPFAYGLNNGFEGAFNDEYAKDIDLSHESEFSYSTMEEDIEGTSPWASFEQGYTGVLVFGNQLYIEEGDIELEEDMFITGSIEYSHFMKNSAFMVKPSFEITQHLNEDASEALEMNIGLFSFKDLSDKMGCSFEGGFAMTKEDSDADMVNGMNLNTSFLYFPHDDIELSLSLGYEVEDLDSDDDGSFSIGLGFDYEIFAK